MKPVIITFFVIFTLTVSNGNAEVYNPQAPTPQGSPRFNYLEIELLRTLDEKRNYFISPASIKVTLGMLLEGAKGRSASEISQALRTANNDKLQSLLKDLNVHTDSAQVESANGAFISKTLSVNPQFQQNLQDYYKADIRRVDFTNSVATSNLINNWVRNSTHGLISDIVNPEYFRAGGSLVLANALYFKGLWKNEFEERSTSLKCFRNHRKNCINARMMQTVDTFNYKFIDALEAQALQLRYGDGKYAMLVLLPSDKQTVNGLIQDIQHHTFDSIVNQLESTEVFLNLPRFEIDFSADISSILQEVGIREVFGDNSDLTGITQGEKVKVSKVIHKAKVEVNEKGTIAAASTGVNVVPLMGSSMPRFIADHPFLFFIYQIETNNVLFEGRFNEPPEVYDEIFPRPASRPSATKQSAVPLSVDYQSANRRPDGPIYFQAETNRKNNAYY